MATETFVFPGGDMDPGSLPSNPKLPLKLGPGLRHIPPDTVTPTVAGELSTDKRKNAVWIEFNSSHVYNIFLNFDRQPPLIISAVHTHSRRSRHSYHPT